MYPCSDFKVLAYKLSWSGSTEIRRNVIPCTNSWQIILQITDLSICICIIFLNMLCVCVCTCRIIYLTLYTKLEDTVMFYKTPKWVLRCWNARFKGMENWGFQNTWVFEVLLVTFEWFVHHPNAAMSECSNDAR